MPYALDMDDLGPKSRLRRLQVLAGIYRTTSCALGCVLTRTIVSAATVLQRIPCTGPEGIYYYLLCGT